MIFNIEIELTDGTEKEIELDVSSIDLEQDEKAMDREMRELIKEQYPVYAGKVVKIYC